MSYQKHTERIQALEDQRGDVWRCMERITDELGRLSKTCADEVEGADSDELHPMSEELLDQDLTIERLGEKVRYAKVLIESALARIDKAMHSNFVREAEDFLEGGDANAGRPAVSLVDVVAEAICGKPWPTGKAEAAIRAVAGALDEHYGGDVYLTDPGIWLRSQL